MINGIRNILLNLSGGLLPKDLTKEEVALLEEEFGEMWFYKIGYNEKKFEKPGFENE